VPGNKSEHRELKERLGSAEGVTIAARYFESVGRILADYYARESIPPIAELAPVDFGTFGITI
jgi:hypothetical protein